MLRIVISSDTVTFVHKLTILKQRKEGRKNIGGEGSVYTMKILPQLTSCNRKFPSKCCALPVEGYCLCIDLPSGQ
jgi:hypothetical protein